MRLCIFFMDILTVILIAIGLSMDAFAVSVCKGLGMKSFDGRLAARLGLYFGGFQALMPLLGWALCTGFSEYITAFDHWIAFGLLLFIGGKMIWESFRGDDGQSASAQVTIRELLLLAVATSIDALAIGVTFACTPPTMGIALSVVLIGITTFLFSFGGAYIGKQFGKVLGNKAEIAGGLILIGIGVKILIEHLLQ